MEQKVRFGFLLIQIGFVIGIFFIWRSLRGSSLSSFKLTEADRLKDSKHSLSDSKLADAKMDPKRPLQLPGIRIDGEPHEVLGVKETATVEEINQAYRELMKRYHPDKIGRPGSREWNDAQQIAEALNRAKATLLSRAKKAN